MRSPRAVSAGLGGAKPTFGGQTEIEERGTPQTQPGLSSAQPPRRITGRSSLAVGRGSGAYHGYMGSWAPDMPIMTCDALGWLLAVPSGPPITWVPGIMIICAGRAFAAQVEHRHP